MRKKDFVIAYDIVDKKRLQKIAKFLEKETMRIQYSLYYIKTDKKNLKKIIDTLIQLMDAEDDIRVYRVDLKKALFLNNKNIELIL